MTDGWLQDLEFICRHTLYPPYLAIELEGVDALQVFFHRRQDSTVVRIGFLVLLHTHYMIIAADDVPLDDLIVENMGEEVVIQRLDTAIRDAWIHLGALV